MIKEKIKYYAELFLGIKEVGNNNGWQDVYFDDLNMSFTDLMKTVGWQDTHAWCAYFAELVWKLAYANVDTLMVNKLDKLFSANSVNTFMNFKDQQSKTPVIGSLVIWNYYKDGKATTRGHTGIVVDVQGSVIKTVEGNMGDKVSTRTLIINYEKKENGNNLLGFINPKI